MRAFLTTIACAAFMLSFAMTHIAAGEKLVLGFIVKMPEENWFQSEWVGAERVAAERGFEVMKIGAPDGEKVLTAIDSIASKGGKGFVICTPDVKLGPAIMANANRLGLKVITVDDQFANAKGEVMAEIPYVGLSAYKTGNQVGEAIFNEAKARGWNMDESGICVVTFDELETAKDHTTGAVDKLLELGWPQDKIFYTAQRTTDIPGAFDATNVLLTQQASIKNWGACGINDNTVLGAVRAMEGRQIAAKNVIGVGLGGAECRFELEKVQLTGFFGSFFVSSISHGVIPTEMLYDWIINSKEPAKETRTTGILITRENYREVYKDAGIE